MRAGPVDLPPRWVALSAIMAVVLTFAVIGTSAVMSRSEAATTVHFGFAGDTGETAAPRRWWRLHGTRASTPSSTWATCPTTR